jgi:hypothetical protein
MAREPFKKIPHAEMIARKTMYTFSMNSAPLWVLSLLFLPAVAFGAGFAKQSLFLSKSPIIEGDSVLIYSVVQNNDAVKFDGSLVFFAQKDGGDKEKVGTVAAVIASQGADTVSVSWKPLAGSYTVTAELTQKDGTVVESESEKFTINEKPKPASSEDNSDGNLSAQVQSSADVQAMIAKFVPGLSGVSEPVFSGVDSLRMKAANLLDQGIDWSKSKTDGKKPGEVLGASAQNTSPQGIMTTLSYAAGAAAYYFFSVLKWIVANTGVFYSVVAIAFLYALWRIFAGLRRPNY